MDLSEKLLDFRKNERLSQKDMAKKLGISQQAYANYENGVVKRVSASVVDKFNQLTGSGRVDGIGYVEHEHFQKDMTLADVAALVLKNNAMLNVIMSANAEILAKQTGQTVTAVLSEFQSVYSSYLKKIERGELD